MILETYLAMARPLRVEFAGAIYHVMTRGRKGDAPVLLSFMISNYAKLILVSTASLTINNQTRYFFWANCRRWVSIFPNFFRPTEDELRPREGGRSRG